MSLASTCQRRTVMPMTGIYLAFNPNEDSDQDAAIAAMEACLCDIRSWMINDKLMINDFKTEFMLIGTKALQKTKSATLTIGESIISPSTEPLRNLGAWFDCHFNLNFNITKTCRSAFVHLHNIRRVRKYLSIESAEKLMHVFITSRLDYCNSLLYNLRSGVIFFFASLLLWLEREKNNA